MAIVFDPEGTPVYNEAARTNWGSVIDLTNQGSDEMTGIYLEISIDGTADDEAHEAAIGFLAGEKEVPATGEVNLLDAHAMDTLNPGDSITIGLDLDLLNPPIDDLESGADMELIVTASNE